MALARLRTNGSQGAYQEKLAASVSVGVGVAMAALPVTAAGNVRA